MQSVSVVVKGLLTGVKLQIAAQMRDKKAAQRKPGERHEDFLPHGCRKDLYERPQTWNLREQMNW